MWSVSGSASGEPTPIRPAMAVRWDMCIVWIGLLVATFHGAVMGMWCGTRDPEPRDGAPRAGGPCRARGARARALLPAPSRELTMQLYVTRVVCDVFVREFRTSRPRSLGESCKYI